MEEFIGLDVSMKETSVSIRRDGRRIWRGIRARTLRPEADLPCQRIDFQDHAGASTNGVQVQRRDVQLEAVTAARSRSAFCHA